MGNAVYYVVQTRGEARPTATPTSLPIPTPTPTPTTHIPTPTPTPTTHIPKRPVEEEDGTLLHVEARQQPPEYSYNCQRRGEANGTIRNHRPGSALPSSASSSTAPAAASSSVPSSSAQEVTERSDVFYSDEKKKGQQQQALKEGEEVNSNLLKSVELNHSDLLLFASSSSSDSRPSSPSSPCSSSADSVYMSATNSFASSSSSSASSADSPAASLSNSSSIPEILLEELPPTTADWFLQPAHQFLFDASSSSSASSHNKNKKTQLNRKPIPQKRTLDLTRAKKKLEEKLGSPLEDGWFFVHRQTSEEDGTDEEEGPVGEEKKRKKKMVQVTSISLELDEEGQSLLSPPKMATLSLAEEELLGEEQGNEGKQLQQNFKCYPFDPLWNTTATTTTTMMKEDEENGRNEGETTGLWGGAISHLFGYFSSALKQPPEATKPTTTTKENNHETTDKEDPEEEEEERVITTWKTNGNKDIRCLQTQVSMLQSQVLEMDELRGQVTYLKGLLEDLSYNSNAPTRSLSTSLLPPPSSHLLPPPSASSLAPPPPSSLPPPPPPPPLPPSSSSTAHSTKTTKDGKEEGGIGVALKERSALRKQSEDGEKKQKEGAEMKKITEKMNNMTMNDLEKVIREQIQASDVTSENWETAVSNFLNSFRNHNEQLRKLCSLYPFLIRKLALKPKSAFIRMTLWEKHLFAGMPPAEAQRWRQRKAFEIEKLEGKEAILEEVQKVKKVMEAQRQKEKEQKKQEATKNAMKGMLEELEKSFMANQMRNARQQAEAELEQLEEGSLELDEEDL